MKKHEIRAKFLEFKNSIGINNFSSELSETEFNLLSIVTEYQEKQEHINLTTLSDKLGVTRSAITQIATKLEKKKYIEKYTVSTNKKEIYLKIGEKALEQYNIAMDKITEFFERLYLEIGREGLEKLSYYFSVARKIGAEIKRESEGHVEIKEHC